MDYHNQVIKQRKDSLALMSDVDLYDTANGYSDLEHGAGYYPRTQLIELILNYEYKMPIQNSI